MSSKRAQEDKQLYSLIKGIFETAVSSTNLDEEMLGQMSKETFIKGFRYTNSEIKMRTPAVVRVCKMAQEKLKEFISEDLNLYEATSLFCTGVQITGDHICQMAALDIAFGIWVADILSEADKMDELNNLLPEEFDYNSKIFIDLHHSNDVYERIAYVCDAAETDTEMAKILDRIIALLPQGKITKGIENFDKLAWGIHDIFVKEYYDIVLQRENLVRILDSSLDLSKLGNLSMSALDNEYREKMIMASQLDKLDFAAATLFTPAQHYYDTDATTVHGEKAIRAFNKMNELTVADPYEICGIFYVLKRRQDYRYWAMGPFATAVSFAAKRLPWTGKLEYEEPNGEIELANADIYLPKYNISMFDAANKSNELLNMSQVIYHLSGGGILPRRLNSYRAEKTILKQNGVSDEEVNYITCMAAVLSEIDKRYEYFGTYGDLDDEESSDEQTIEIDDAAIDSIKVLVKDIQDRIKKVNAENHLIEEQRRKLQKDYDELKRLYNEEHRELVDLRNYVFNQNDDAQEESSNTELKIAYPYEAKHNIVVFGGHETWSKAIKPLFANVRFINRDTLPNPDMIKNADIVWVQANSIGHSKYYKILDVVRTYHIPLRYFSYASADKCAEQLVFEDMK